MSTEDLRQPSCIRHTDTELWTGDMCGRLRRGALSSRCVCTLYCIFEPAINTFNCYIYEKYKNSVRQYWCPHLSTDQTIKLWMK